MEQSEEEW